MSEAAVAEKKGWELSKKGNVADKKALADAGMKVESMITSPTTGKNSKIWENGVGYFYDIAAWFPKNMVIVNKDAWNKLDSATQKLIMSEAAIAEKKGWDLSKKGNVADKKALADAGMKAVSYTHLTLPTIYSV